MKKAIITILIVAICTLVFLFSFRYISGASSVDLENADYIEGEAVEKEAEASADEINDTQNGEQADIPSGEQSDIAGGTENNDDTESTDKLENGVSAGDLRAEEIKEYIKERIIPVIVGVLTSLSAVLASLGAIKKSLSRLSGARDDFKNEASERKSEFARQSALLESKAEELSELARLLPQLEKELGELKKSQQKLNEEAYNIGKMVSLGFSGSYAVVKSGNGRKIAALLSQCRALSGKEKDENDIGAALLDETEITETQANGESKEKANERAVKKTHKNGSEAIRNEEN